MINQCLFIYLSVYFFIYSLICLTGTMHSILAAPQLAMSEFTSAVPGQERETVSPMTT